MKTYETNTELVTRMMEYSPTGALSQMFIIEAISRYAKLVAESPPMDHPMINGAAWKHTAEFILNELDNRK